MKVIILFLLILHAFCSNAKENNFTGSTPAGQVTKLFLGIPSSDSVDFIRWQFHITDTTYLLDCNFGISKPNTNGFMDGGVKMNISGKCKKENGYYRFYNGVKTLKALVINTDLFHLVDTAGKLLVGNGGWSYTFNNIKPSAEAANTFEHGAISFKDSMTFEGRTPCKIPGVVGEDVPCYKLKWKIVFYARPQTANEGSFKVFGTVWRSKGPVTGEWKISKSAKGKIVYQLKYDNQKPKLYLDKLDEHILIFLDPEHKALVGDEDLSYTLNRAN